MKFIKENSYDIFKLILNQIAIAVFGLVMSAATSQMSQGIYMTTAVFGIVLYLALTYISARTVGDRDLAPVKSGRKEATPLKGLYIGICANALNILCGVLIFVCSFFLIYQPQSQVLDKNGNTVEVYLCTKESTTDAADSGDGAIINDHVAKDTLIKTDIYSDHKDTLYTYDKNGNGREVKVYANYNSGSDVLPLYDANGDRITLYGSPYSVNTNRGNLESWANLPYTISFTFCTFLQIVFVPINNELLGGVQWYFILTPVLPIIMSAIGYYLASKGKRMFPFLPERSTKPGNRFHL